MIILKRMHGKILRRKSDGEKHGIRLELELENQDVSVKETERNSIMSDSTGLALLMLFQLVLSVATLTVLDNPNEDDN